VTNSSGSGFFARPLWKLGLISDQPILCLLFLLIFLSQDNLSVIQDPGVFFMSQCCFPLMVNYDFTTLLFDFCDFCAPRPVQIWNSELVSGNAIQEFDSTVYALPHEQDRAIVGVHLPVHEIDN